MEPGSEIAGRYRLGRLLGQGGFGEVWAAADLLRDRPVAMKFLHRGMSTDKPVVVAKFRREAKIAARLEHPGITRVDDFGEHDGQWFLVMELLQGRTLAAELDDHPPARIRPLPPHRADGDRRLGRFGRPVRRLHRVQRPQGAGRPGRVRLGRLPSGRRAPRPRRENLEHQNRPSRHRTQRARGHRLFGDVRPRQHRQAVEHQNRSAHHPPRQTPGSRLLGGVQPGRHHPGHRGRRQDHADLGRRDRHPYYQPDRAQRRHRLGGVRPGRRHSRRRRQRPHRQDLAGGREISRRVRGRPSRRRSPRTGRGCWGRCSAFGRGSAPGGRRGRPVRWW